MKLTDYVTLPMLLIAAGGSVALLGSLITTARQNKEKLKPATKTKLFNYVTLPMILIAMGGSIALLGSFIATVRQNQEKLDSATKRAEFEHTIREKSDQIAKMSEELKAYATGGQMLAYALPDIPVMPREPIHLLLGREGGDYPLYDIRIRVRDQSVALPFDQIAKKIDARLLSRDDEAKGEFRFEIGTIGPGVAPSFGSWKLDKDEHLELSIWIYARNGVVAEQLSLRRLNQKWRLAVRATRESDKKVVFDSVDPGYPRNSKGEVLW